MTDRELLAKTANWSQALFKFIPESKLQIVYLRAVEDHETEFPISAMNLKSAWKKICEEDRHRREVARLNTDKGALYGCVIVCLRCRDTNVEPVHLPDGTYKGSKPGCDHRPLEEGEWLWKREKELEEKAESVKGRTIGYTGRNKRSEKLDVQVKIRKF